MSTEKRYQVFVSSTYDDLREERKEVMQALLELDCIPAGMELFPATDDDQWTLIQRVIDECDYYILILGGRYGSVGPRGISYTEQEYVYALETGKPIIAFLHKAPENIALAKSEKNPDSVPELLRFRELAQKKLCKYWTTPAELGSVVSRSLVRLIKTHAMPGWIRADAAAEAVAATEILRLKKLIEQLESKLKETRVTAPSGAESLAKGDEEFEIEFTFHARDKEYEGWNFTRSMQRTWDDIFEVVGPHLIGGVSDTVFKSLLNGMAEEAVDKFLESDQNNSGFQEPSDVTVSTRDEQTIKIQLRALGLIERKEKQDRSVWVLTPYGDSALINLIAIQSEGIEGEQAPSDLPNV